MESEKEAPFVTVIMPVHKAVKYRHLCEAIDSILNQDYVNYELIVIIDGESTAEQNDLLYSLNSRLSATKIIKLKENVGPGAARNIGIKNANGKYIAIMDSDDVSVPERLTSEVLFLESNEDISVVGSHCEVINNDGCHVGYRSLPTSFDALRIYSLFFCPLNNPTVMGRADVFKKHLYDEKFRQGEDYRLWVRLLSDKLKLSNISKPLVMFRVSDDLYKRRSGYHKAHSDFVNRLYAVRIAPFYLKPFVLVFAFLTFASRFLPVSVIRKITLSLDFIRKKIFV